MIKEICNFLDRFDPKLKNAGLKAKDGIHVLLEMKKKEDTLYLDRESVSRYCYTKKATEFDFPFLQKCATLVQVAWCVNTNKCFDLPAKGIHSASPYCVAFKKESLEGGEKYAKDKIKIYDRINTYFANALTLIDSEEEKERLKIFWNFINSKEKLEALISIFQNDFDELKSKEYVIFYLDESIEKYQTACEKYFADKLFNTPDYNVNIEEEVYGTSDFFNGFPSKKPFLTHQSATFDIAGRVSGKEARSLFEFTDILGRNILPRPLPVFIYEEELQTGMIRIISKEVDEGKRTGYKEIIESLYKKHKRNIGNYYLLYYLAGAIKDFDFVSKFEYDLIDKDNNYW